MPAIRPAKGYSSAPLIVTVILLAVMLACGTFFVVSGVHNAPPVPEDSAVTEVPTTDVPPADTAQTEPADVTSVPVPDTEPADNTQAPPADTTSPAEDQKWKTISVSAGDIHTGNLILVNYQHEYKFPSAAANVTFYGNKAAYYKLRSIDVSVQKEALDAFNALIADYNEKTGVYNVIVISGYRDLESQKTIYADYVDSQGVDYAEKYVAQPGYSEHHTGLCVDLAIYTDEGTQFGLSSQKTYPDFLQIAAKHGYVLRYDPDKVDLTHIGGEEWHFRYVGYPHSHYMTVKKLCLEEYITLLQKHTTDGEHLCFSDADSRNWEIYYVPSEGDTTSLPVPADAPYTVSGDNISGYIVTVER